VMKTAILGLVLLLPTAAVAQQQQRVVSLDDALKLARQNQPTLRVARAQTDVARARVDEARSALLPQLTGRLSYQRTQREAGGAPVVINNQVVGANGGSDQYVASVTVSQLVWDFGQTTGRLRAASATADAQEATGEVTLRDTLLNVRTIYFQCRA